MAKVLEVLTYPTASLKKKSVDVTKFDSKLADFVADMFKTLTFEDGLGLAAPQVGENINLFITDVGPKDPKNPDERLPNPICLINPKIVNRDGEIIWEEGCLSCPDLLVDVERARNITVVSFDVEGREQTHQMSELAAVCVQHEMDHLKGILLADKISRLQRELYGKKRIRERKAAGSRD